MKKISFPTQLLLQAQAVMAAFQSIFGKVNEKTMLLLLSMLLLSFHCFGQATYKTVSSGNWETLSNWDISISGNKITPTTLPTSVDDVVIGGGHTVTVNSTTAACSQLFIASAQNNGSGNAKSRHGALDIKSGTILSVNSFSSTYSGSHDQALVTIRTGGELKVSGANGLAPWTNNYTLETASTITYNGNAGQTITALNYRNLILSGTGTKTSPAALNVTENLTNSTTLHAGASTISIGGNFTNMGTLDSGTSTVIYNGGTSGASQEVAGVAYNNLAFSGTSTKTAKEALTTKGNLQISPGSNFHAGNFTHTISGNFSNEGTMNAGSSTISVQGNFSSTNYFIAGTSSFILNGLSKTIALSGNVSPSTSLPASFHHLTISNGPATLNSNLYTSGVLDLEDKILTGENNTLHFGTTGQLKKAEDAGKYVLGNLSAVRPLRAGTSAAPTAEIYGNIGFAHRNSGAVVSTPNTAEVYITVLRQTGVVTQMGDITSVPRIFELSSPTLASAPDLELSFSFMRSELTEDPIDYLLYGERTVGGVVEFTSLSSDQTLNATGYTFTRAKESHLGKYTVAAESQAITILPVELTWFKAQRQAQGVQLTWETASEKDNKGFEVQVSTNGKNFNNLSCVAKRA